VATVHLQQQQPQQRQVTVITMLLISHILLHLLMVLTHMVLQLHQQTHVQDPVMVLIVAAVILVRSILIHIDKFSSERFCIFTFYVAETNNTITKQKEKQHTYQQCNSSGSNKDRATSKTIKQETKTQEQKYYKQEQHTTNDSKQWQHTLWVCPSGCCFCYFPRFSHFFLSFFPSFFVFLCLSGGVSSSSSFFLSSSLSSSLTFLPSFYIRPAIS
jgi:hypothetical protein